MAKLIKRFQQGAEFIAAAMLAAIFITFIIQIVSRRISDQPIGWTIDLCLTLWIWIVFFGNAFIVRSREQVTFDILYISSPEKIRRILASISALAIIITFMWSYLPTWDYIDWMKMKRSGTLGISMRPILIVYMVFLTATIVKYSYIFIKTLRKNPPDKDHLLSIEEGKDIKSHKNKRGSA